VKLWAYRAEIEGELSVSDILAFGSALAAHSAAVWVQEGVSYVTLRVAASSVVQAIEEGSRLVRGAWPGAWPLNDTVEFWSIECSLWDIWDAKLRAEANTNQENNNDVQA
jgi:hypothetical protein